MKTSRLVLNLLAFLVVTVALIAYGVVDLLGNPLASSLHVSAVFPNASGLFDNFSVELNGVDVGTVSSVQLVHGGARVDMSIDHGVSIPSNVVAGIDIANDLGEQVVELTPRSGRSDPPLRDNAVIPVAPDSVPADVGQVVASATRLLDAIPSGNLNALLADLATALQNRAGDLRTIVSAGTTFSQEFLQYQTQFNALLANAPPVLDAVSAVGPALRQSLVNTESLLEVLAHQKGDVTTLLQQGSQATGLLGSLVTNQAPDLACLFHDVAQISTNLAQPANLGHLSQTLATNQYFFGAVSAVTVQGEAKALSDGAPANPDQYFLRTRLLIPPATPAGVAYPAQQGLPPVKPGAGCSTELGQGVGPATQAGFTPAAGGSLSPAPASESQVRGAGDGDTPVSTEDAAYRGPTPGGDPLGPILLGALLVPALALAWGARPSRRRTRRRG
ncbi:MAG: MCE family protein [Actinomycetota bacterium]|jgi:virulence factor Mce-like protein|nr:MCE family protein [Actinomycetota bacterium]